MRNIQFTVVEVRKNSPYSVMVSTERRDGQEFSYIASNEQQPKVGETIYVSYNRGKPMQ